MVRLKKLGHMGIRAPDMKRALDFYSGVFGLEVSERTGEGAVYLRCGPDHHSQVLYPAGQGRPGLDHVAIGWNSTAGWSRSPGMRQRASCPLI